MRHNVYKGWKIRDQKYSGGFRVTYILSFIEIDQEVKKLLEEYQFLWQ